MKILDYFRKVDSMPVGEVRQFIKENKIDALNLIDVRQPKEYEKGHIPGARLLPVSKIDELTAEIDPQKPTVVY